MYLLFIAVCLIDNVLSEVYYLPQPDPDVKLKTTDDTLPWMGVLRVKPSQDEGKEAISTLVLIDKFYAIGCADDIDKIEKSTLTTSTLVTFFNHERFPWNTFVTDYHLHPEFLDETVNTIALLKLDTKSKVPSFMWQPILWPKKFYSVRNHSSGYSVSYTERNKTLEQVITKMKPVRKKYCIKFYKEEGMDFQNIRPTHYNCFKAAGENSSCVYEAGMALAANYSGRWTLIGISTYGPGCSVPARFIEFFPYIPWAKTLLDQNEDPEVKYTRRSDWKTEPGEDLDTHLLAILYNYTIDIFPNKQKITWLNTSELACPDDSDRVIYHEKGYISMTHPVPMATVFYALSIFDENYEDVKCIKIELSCINKTATQLFVQRGFGQEDYEPMIRKDVLPYITQQGGIKYADKILYVKDSHVRYRNKSITTIWFKFVFLRKGEIEVIFFSKTKQPTTSTTPASQHPTTTPAPETSTSTRYYKPYQGWMVHSAKHFFARDPQPGG